MSVNMNKVTNFFVLIFCVELAASFPCSQENIASYPPPHATLQFSNLAQPQNVAFNSAYQNSVNTGSIVQPGRYNNVGASVPSGFNERGTVIDNNMYPGVGLQQNVNGVSNSEIQNLIQRKTAAQQRKNYDNYFYRNQQSLLPQAPIQQQVATLNEQIDSQVRLQNAPNIQHSFSFAGANRSPLLNTVPYVAPIPVHNPYPLQHYETVWNTHQIQNDYQNTQQLLSIKNGPNTSGIENPLQNNVEIPIQTKLHKQTAQAVAETAGLFNNNGFERFGNRQPQQSNAGYDIQRILAENPSIRHALTNTKHKKRYLVVHRNGTVEHVDRLEMIAERHPSYILVPAGTRIPQRVTSSATTVTKASPLESVATATANSRTSLPQPAPPITSPISFSPIESLPSLANLPSSESSTVPLIRDNPTPITESLPPGSCISPPINALPSIGEQPSPHTSHDTLLPIDAPLSITEEISPATSCDNSLPRDAPPSIAESPLPATSQDTPLPLVVSLSIAEPDSSANSHATSLPIDALPSIAKLDSSTASNDISLPINALPLMDEPKSSATSSDIAPPIAPTSTAESSSDSLPRDAPSSILEASSSTTSSISTTSPTNDVTENVTTSCEESSKNAKPLATTSSAQRYHSSDKPACSETEASFTTKTLSETESSSTSSTSSTEALPDQNSEGDNGKKTLPILKTVAPPGLDIKKIRSTGKPSVWFRTTDPDIWEKLVGDDFLYNAVYFFEVPAQTRVEKDTKITEYCNGTVIEEVTETLWDTEDGEPKITKTIKLIETDKNNCT